MSKCVSKYFDHIFMSRFDLCSFYRKSGVLFCRLHLMEMLSLSRFFWRVEHMLTSLDQWDYLRDSTIDNWRIVSIVIAVTCLLLQKCGTHSHWDVDCSWMMWCLSCKLQAPALTSIALEAHFTFPCAYLMSMKKLNMKLRKLSCVTNSDSFQIKFIIITTSKISPIFQICICK